MVFVVRFKTSKKLIDFNTQQNSGTACQKVVVWSQGETGKCLENKSTEAK